MFYVSRAVRVSCTGLRDHRLRSGVAGGRVLVGGPYEGPLLVGGDEGVLEAPFGEEHLRQSAQGQCQSTG